MKRFVAFVAIAAMALVLVALPAFAISGVSGSATTDNTILRVQVGSTIVKIGADSADSLNTSTLKAVGRFVTGSIGPVGIGTPVEKSATKASDSGSTPIGSGITKTIPGLASVKLQGGKVAAAVASNKVSSSVDFALGNLNALAGLVNIGTTNSSTDSIVGTGSSVVSRDVSIGNVSVFDLRSLLDSLGVDPLAMACAAIQSTGTALDGVANTACGALDGVTDPVTGALPAGLGSIDDTASIIGVLETALAVPCGLVPICGTLFTQIDALQAQIDAIQTDPGSTCATVLEQLGTVSGGLDTVIATLTGLTGDATIGATLTGLLAPVTGQADALGTATSALDTACNTLLGIVDDVLDTSLLSLDLVKVTMDLAAKSSPTAAAAGTIGALKVGNLTVVSANDLVALGGQLNTAIDTVESALGTVFDATGLGLSAPILDLLKVTTSKGKNSSGTYFANAAMSVAHLALPSANLNLPVTNPLDVLSGLGSFAPAAVHVSALTTPAVAVDAGVFSGAATFKAAPKNNPGGTLATTGVGDSGLVLAGMLTLIGAAFLRRTSKVN
jgi:hypothetical protein